jgi:hypothetical protein
MYILNTEYELCGFQHLPMVRADAGVLNRFQEIDECDI